MPVYCVCVCANATSPLPPLPPVLVPATRFAGGCSTSNVRLPLLRPRTLNLPASLLPPRSTPPLVRSPPLVATHTFLVNAVRTASCLSAACPCSHGGAHSRPDRRSDPNADHAGTNNSEPDRRALAGTNNSGPYPAHKLQLRLRRQFAVLRHVRPGRADEPVCVHGLHRRDGRSEHVPPGRLCRQPDQLHDATVRH